MGVRGFQVPRSGNGVPRNGVKKSTLSGRVDLFAGAHQHFDNLSCTSPLVGLSQPSRLSLPHVPIASVTSCIAPLSSISCCYTRTVSPLLNLDHPVHRCMLNALHARQDLWCRLALVSPFYHHRFIPWLLPPRASSQPRFTCTRISYALLR